MSLTLVCGPISTTIYENADNPVTLSQEVYPSLATAIFTFDNYYVSNTECPITSTLLSKTSSSSAVTLDNGLRPTYTTIPFLRNQRGNVVQRY
jgi:hypothetical protein